jgi:ABC-2 type transport system ATP-binding protein
VCERVVIMYQGRVAAQGGVRELCARRQDRYRLQVLGNPSGFVEELRLEGVKVLNDNGRGDLRVAVPDGFATRAFFLLAENTGASLRGLQHDDESLEELFLRLIDDTPAGKE